MDLLDCFSKEGEALPLVDCESKKKQSWEILDLCFRDRKQ